MFGRLIFSCGFGVSPADPFGISGDEGCLGALKIRFGIQKSNVKCHKWRKVATKDEFETIRENFTEEPWYCSKTPDCSCEHTLTLNMKAVVSGSLTRLVIMRGDLSKMDTYYVMPNGKRVRCAGEVDKFL
ncbi:hypothetical protein ABZP36_013707 [Zizania latifolia]